MKTFSFMGNSKRFFLISGIIIAAIILISLFAGVEMDIEFKGGAIITYSFEGTIDRDEFARIAQDVTATTISIQESTNLATQSDTMVLSLPGNASLTSDQMAQVTEALRQAFPDSNIQVISNSNVDATMGAEFFAKCLTAVGLASVLMIIYVTLRFRKIGGFSAGVMGVVALVHDIIIVFGVFVIFGIPISGNFIAVVLTILGYSLNDTIVIYDRIRENKRLYGEKLTLSEIVDRSIGQCLKRTLNTTITTVISMVVVSVVALIFGVGSILTFAFPMILGLISGVYSSICIAGPLWVKWREYRG
ncbi:MAG: protein translocase subunit SecF [Oscillospiraceae bacterium]|jgi:preprotein translocase SecF subunit|nr:protein translocase subunit SecF [Oscillospiraceae bacterium]